MSSTSLREIVLRQQATIDEQGREIERLRALVEAGSEALHEVPSSRRNFLWMAGAAAVGAVGVGVIRGESAEADDGSPVIVGGFNTTSAGSSASTLIDYTFAQPRALGGNSNAILAVAEGAASGVIPAAVAGIADVVAETGVGGASSNPEGFGTVGIGVFGAPGVAGLSDSVGVVGFSTGGPDLWAAGTGLVALEAHLPVGPPSSGSYFVGDLIRDDLGNLFVNVETGSPGRWRKIAGPQSAGAFHAISPKRAYDSRSASKIGTDQERTVSVANDTGGAPVVPAGSSAVAITLTATETEDVGGFLAVRPAGTPYAGTSSINWFGPGQNIATTVISALGGDRQLIVRGFNPTHFIVDVTGYYL